jgi:hypothetical protein
MILNILLFLNILTDTLKTNVNLKLIRTHF